MPDLNFKAWLGKRKGWTRPEFLAYISRISPYDAMGELPNVLSRFDYFIFDPAFQIGRTNIMNYHDEEQERVDTYSQMNPKTMPPIIVGNDGRIIDGSHRTKAMLKRGQRTIPAYVGLQAWEID
jgi:hypothetical protein